ncbi:MAG: ATP-binding cassette domain-containing protein [Oscillospiraceae bacterium]|nr:ATP-binding cassette domain-containing protein [Oscillospiraceae bacterium]
MTVTLKELSKSYGGSPVLERISLTLEPGKPLCVTGPSGCGKTTLLRCVLGLEKPDSGTVTYSSGSRPRFGVLFQEDRLFDHLDAVENLRLAAGEKDRDALRAALLALLPSDVLDRPVSALSGGQRRRVALVRALRPGGAAVILDEPFTGLDAAAAAQASAFILRELGDRPLLLALHRKDIPDWCENILELGAEGEKRRRD